MPSTDWTLLFTMVCYKASFIETHKLPTTMWAKEVAEHTTKNAWAVQL
jgi:hypothetical protein